MLIFDKFVLLIHIIISIFFKQVGFIDAICLPIYNSFSVYSDNRLQPLLDGCLENKKQWLKLAEHDKFDAWDNDDTTEGDGGC